MTGQPESYTVQSHSFGTGQFSLGLITIASPSKFTPQRGTNWPARILCRRLSWKMVPGHIRRGFRSAMDGAGTVLPLATKASFQRRMFWKHSAIWDMPAVVRGRRRSAPGMPCVSPFLLRRILLSAKDRQSPQRFLPALSLSAMFVRRITVPSKMEVWNLICHEQCGFGGMTMNAFRRWQNVFWSRT